MNITEQLLLEMGFTNEGTIDNENKQWYTLYVDMVGFISLTNEKESKIYHSYFHKNKDDSQFNIVNRIEKLSELIETITRVTKFESIKL
jgi:dimeric dUTPase (all-alpha-NTP-PPase superfamily)